MQGRYQEIGGRRTYIPPFVNERFDGPPYWACTFTSLLNGANVGWLGEKPATQREVRALARASGDVDLRGGSRSSHMVRAIRVRYGKDVRIEHRTPEQAVDRLKSGWAMVAAVTYGGLPKHHRRWSPRFTGGHRVVVLGWQNNHTRLLDPMANKGLDYAGEWIRWSDFEPAWWAGEQLWFHEGMYQPRPVVEPAAEPTPSVEPRPVVEPAAEPTPSVEPRPDCGCRAGCGAQAERGARERSRRAQAERGARADRRADDTAQRTGTVARRRRDDRGLPVAGRPRSATSPDRRRESGDVRQGRRAAAASTVRRPTANPDPGGVGTLPWLSRRCRRPGHLGRSAAGALTPDRSTGPRRRGSGTRERAGRGRPPWT